MLANDPFSRWMGVELVSISPNHCTLQMKVRPEMLNGFGVGHGGVTFALADSAFAFASNSTGRLSVAVENNIAYPNPVKEGDTLTAIASPQNVGNKLATYDVRVTNQNQEVVGIFRGTVYRTSRPVGPS